jgi:head-tail adaptor
MPTLSSDEITAMRATLEDTALPDTCNILSVTQTSDGQGGFTEAWGTATAGIACRLDNTSSRELLSGDAVQHFTGWMLTLPHNTSIAAGNRVEIDNTSYNVVGFDDGKSWQLDLRVLLEMA